MINQDKQNRELLTRNWNLLARSIETLHISVEKANKIGVKQEYSFEEMETFDSLTSKFNRTSDLYTQKILRSCWSLLHEPFMPFIDMLNKSEKIGLIKSADEMIEIRDLRNQIAHEYIPEAIQELIPEVINMAALLQENITMTRTFATARGWLSENK
jgi:hypothetical protein